jgi:hypothetical protein
LRWSPAIISASEIDAIACEIMASNVGLSIVIRWS